MPYKGTGKLPGNLKAKNAPLADQLANDKLAQGKGRTKKRERQPEEDDFMTDAMSNKVMLAAPENITGHNMVLRAYGNCFRTLLGVIIKKGVFINMSATSI